MHEEKQLILIIHPSHIKHHTNITESHIQSQKPNILMQERVKELYTLSALIPPITGEVPGKYLKLGGIYLNVKKPIEK